MGRAVPAAARISADGSGHQVQQYRSWPSTAPQSARSGRSAK